MNRVKRGYAEFWAERVHIRWKPFFASPEELSHAYAQQAAFVRHVLSLAPGATALDLGCGAGEHALLLGRQNVAVTGIDTAPAVIAHANRLAGECKSPAKFRCDDMRTFRSEAQFDAVYTSSGTFGLFDDAGNQAVLETIARCLKTGGRFLIGPSNEDLLGMPSYIRKDWMLCDDGCLLIERTWDKAKRLVGESLRFIDSTGTMIEQGDQDEDPWWKSAKVYGLAELKKMIQSAGLRFAAAYGSFELPPEPYAVGSPRLLIAGYKGD